MSIIYISGRQKFDAVEEEVKIVLNECGTEVDGEYFNVLHGGEVLLLLRSDEIWIPGRHLHHFGSPCYMAALLKFYICSVQTENCYSCRMVLGKVRILILFWKKFLPCALPF